jgi:hypothetical protein
VTGRPKRARRCVMAKREQVVRGLPVGGERVRKIHGRPEWVRKVASGKWVRKVMLVIEAVRGYKLLENEALIWKDGDSLNCTLGNIDVLSAEGWPKRRWSGKVAHCNKCSKRLGWRTPSTLGSGLCRSCAARAREKAKIETAG